MMFDPDIFRDIHPTRPGLFLELYAIQADEPQRGFREDQGQYERE
jgi:hypothetical protein